MLGGRMATDRCASFVISCLQDGGCVVVGSERMTDQLLVGGSTPALMASRAVVNVVKEVTVAGK